MSLTYAKEHSFDRTRKTTHRVRPEATRRSQPIQSTFQAPSVQLKSARALIIGQPRDRYEREADRVADAVMRTPEPQVQRQPEEEKEEKLLQTKTEAEAVYPIQRHIDEKEEEEERLQTKPIYRWLAKGAANQISEVPSHLERGIRFLRGGGQPLPASLKSFFETRFSYDFNQVRVHKDSNAAETARMLNGRAFTFGRDIAFGAGQYAPETAAGRQLLAHELAHVVQQQDSSNPSTLYLAFYEELDYESITKQIHDAIAGLGTDEEAVYYALQRLEKDPNAISRLEALFLSKYGETLEDAIRGDFSGTELEYALQLINKGMAGSAQRIVAAPTTTTDWEAAASRIRTAVEGVGTDEEAINGVLRPLDRDPTKIDKLKTTYYGLYSEDLVTRIRSEMSGTELGYALYFLRLASSPTEEAVAKEAAGMVGQEMTWVRSGPSSGNTFETWVSAPTEGAAPPVFSLTRINCWEMVMLAAYRAGMTSWQWMHDLYIAGVPNWSSHMVAALSSGTPIVYGAPGSPAPILGDIVFFNGIAHVALATGEKDASARSKIISFWPPPGTAFTPGGTLDDVKTATIEELVGWLMAHGVLMTVTFAGAPW